MYEYTVVEPFSLGMRAYRIGDKITDQGTIDKVLVSHARNVARHAVTTPPEAHAEADGADGGGDAHPPSVKPAQGAK